jgi:hypothetical protein
MLQKEAGSRAANPVIARRNLGKVKGKGAPVLN